MKKKSVRMIGLASLAAVALSGCSEIQFLSQASKEIVPVGGKGDIQTTDGAGGNGARYKVGSAYQIKGSWYYPKVDYNYSEKGVASWYGPKFHGRQTANGAIFDMNKVSAAHKTLPLPSIVRVTNLENGRSLKIKVNDRGPYAHNRIIDLSRRAAELLGFKRQGTALVQVDVLEAESRQLASFMQNGKSFDDQPPPPAASPSVAVQAEELEAPEGIADSTPSSENHKVEVASASSEPVPVTRETLPQQPDSDESYTVVPVVAAPKIYIQAGAFSQYSNAVVTKARLSVVGPTVIQQVNKAERPLFRVRVGPFEKVEDADKLQEAIANAGYPDARIIIAE